MHVYSAEALVLRTYRFGEADRVVVFLTEDRGKKRGVAKHATASRRRFGGALEPLTRGRATYAERETQDLVRLDRVEPLQTPLETTAGRENDVGAHVLGHAAYFAELLDEWAPENSANERLFRLGAAVGATLNGAGSVDALARYFEFWLMRLEGVYPAIDLCPRCGHVDLADGAVLVLAEREYQCPACASGGPHISADAVAFLNAARVGTPADVMNARVRPGALRELEYAQQALITLHLEKELRSVRVLKELRPES